MELETLFPNPHFASNLNDWLFAPCAGWTQEESKQFESALAVYDKETPGRWVNIAAMIPGKSVFDVMSKYKELEEDLIEIEAGRVPIPWCFALDGRDHDRLRKKGSAGSGRGSDHERKKGIPWTEDEHRRFLKGLLKYGKGDWRNISRNFVVSKTPTQVASHAQKYFIRQQLLSSSSNSNPKDNRRRPSIHDITTLNLQGGDSSALPLYSDNSNPNNNSSSITPFHNQKPDFSLLSSSWPAASSPCDLAPPTGLRLQEKGLCFGGFGANSPLYGGVQSTRYRIYG